MISKISRRGFLTAIVSLGAASAIPPLTLAQAREFLHFMKGGVLLDSKPRATGEFSITPSTSGIIVNGLCLNETAFHIFSLCDGKHTVFHIARLLKNHYDLPLKQAMADVSFTLSVLSHLGLIAL